MTRRRGEITRADLQRKWPYHVAISAGKLRGATYGIVHRFAETLSARRTYLMHRDDHEFVVFCFANPNDAQAFYERFGGERLA
jgi:hypothetical protein